MASPPPRRILLIAHDVTLAHVGRPLALGKLLHAAGHDVTLATSRDSARFVTGFPGRHVELAPTGRERFVARLAKGERVFELAELKRFAAEDEALLAAQKPDLVIGDFRLSLSVTARRAGVPYATITNAYWHPSTRPHFVVPDLPMVRFLGVAASQALFDLARPAAFGWHARPLNALRRHYGLPSLGPDLRRIYTDADLALFSDIPELYGLRDDPPGAAFVGPLQWSPRLPLPAWWSALDPRKPLVYMTLGSSGDGARLPEVVTRLAGSGVQLVVATAGSPAPEGRDVFCADYLPGDLVASRAAAVICNGGSPTTAQALAHGVPVIGIPGNLDQHLHMHYVARAGAGLVVRTQQLRGDALSHALGRVLSEASFRTAAARIARLIAARPPAEAVSRALGRGELLSAAGERGRRA